MELSTRHAQVYLAAGLRAMVCDGVMLPPKSPSCWAAMSRILAAAVALTLVVAIAPAASAAPKAGPAKAAAAAKARPADGADARDPATLTALLSSLSAKAQVVRREGAGVFLTVTSPTEIFSAQFEGCDKGGRSCQALLFDRQGDVGAPTLEQLNAFNQTSMMCRLYRDKGGKAHVEYSALLFAGQGREALATHLNAWRGCIGDFNAFQRDPSGFLAASA
jgi:hypothetical protein